MSSPVDGDVDAHLTWATQVRGLTAGTVRARRSALGSLSRALGGPLRDATEEDLLRWQLDTSTTAKPATATAYRSHVAAFYGWLADTGALAASPAGARRLPVGGLLDRWERVMRAQGLAERTVTDRRKVVELAARRTDQRPADMTTDALAGFLGDLPSAGTRSTYWGALQAWFVWLVDVEELRADNPLAKLRKPREPRRRARPVTDDQLTRVLAAANRRRTRTWVLLGVYQGLRVHEIAKVRGEDVDLVAGTLRVVGKGGSDSLMPLHPVIAAEASAYPAAGWWFPSYAAYGRADEPVLANTVSQIIGNTFRRAGVECSAHQLRHWFGTNALRAAGGNLRVAQELLRHASPSTTALYTQVDDAERRAALVALVAPSSAGAW